MVQVMDFGCFSAGNVRASLSASLLVEVCFITQCCMLHEGYYSISQLTEGVVDREILWKYRKMISRRREINLRMSVRLSVHLNKMKSKPVFQSSERVLYPLYIYSIYI